MLIGGRIWMFLLWQKAAKRVVFRYMGYQNPFFVLNSHFYDDEALFSYQFRIF